jgi:PII-like signaling protein
MQGFQVTFFTNQDRRQATKPMAEWLLDLAKGLEIDGATSMAGSEGFGHHHRLHSHRFFELGDQPIEVTMAVSAEEIQQLFACLREAQVQLFYVVSAVEFGTTGIDDIY